MIDKFLDWLSKKLYSLYIILNERKFNGELDELIFQISELLAEARQKADAEGDQSRCSAISEMFGDAIEARLSGDVTRFKQIIARLQEMV